MTPIDRLNHLRLRAHIALWRHGIAWLVATAAMVAVVILQIHVIAPGQAELARWRRPPAHSPAHAAAHIGLATPEPGGHLALTARVLAAPPLDEQLRTLATLASAATFPLARADYQRRPLAAVPLLQWQVTQPVQTNYPALRRYLEAVLRELPNASLDEITVHRDDISHGQVRARLRWSLWLPGAPVTAQAIAQVAAQVAAAGDPGVIPLIPRHVLLPPSHPASPARHLPLRDLFAAHNWTPPSPPMPSAPPSLPPLPPAPFTYLGKKHEDGKWEVYVQHQDRSLVLREGDTPDPAWRVDQIGTTTMTLTYLPLGQTRTLAIGDDR